MPKNFNLTELSNSKEEREKWDNSPALPRNAAIDALLRADATNVSAMRQAVISHKAFWQQFSPLKSEAIYQNPDDLFGAEDISGIRQMLANLRVLHGLREASDDVLVKILSNNEDACRDYLATRRELGNLNQTSGWSDKKNYIFPENNIHDIQKQAGLQLLPRLINQIKDSTKLTPLLEILQTEPNNREQVKSALKAINCPPEFSSLFKSLTKENKAMIEGELANRIALLKFVNSEHFLHHPLDDGELKKLLNEEGLDEFEQALQGEFSLDLEISVTPENIGSIKTALLQNYIKNKIVEPAVLFNLDAANVNDFRGILIKKLLKIDSVDWITEENLDEIKQTTRSRLFELIVGFYSPSLGAKPRPELLKALTTLPPKEQRDLMMKNLEMTHLMNAKDESVIKYYLGENNPAVPLIKAENERLAGFRKIHNSVIAKFLANYTPKIDSLSDAAITEINKALNDHKATDLTVDTNLARLICRIADSILIDQDGFCKQYDDKIPDSTALIEQNNYNEKLYSTYNVFKQSNNPHTRLLEVFLSMEKTGVAEPEKIIQAFDQSTNLTAFIDALLPKLNESVSREEQSIRNLARAYLAHELPSTLFNEIKQQVLNNQFKKNDPILVQDAAAEVEGALREVGISHNFITADAEHDIIKIINANLNPSQLYNPEFHSEARVNGRKMEKHYQAISEYCDHGIEELTRLQEIVQRQLKTIPKEEDNELDPNLDQNVKKHIAQLRNKLIAEEVKIKADLEAYRQAQLKLSGKGGILETIKRAQNPTYDGQFDTYGVRWRVCEAAHMPLYEAKRMPSANPSQAGLAPAESQVRIVLLEGLSIPKGRLGVCDITYPAVSAGPNSFESHGRIIVDPAPADRAAWRVKTEKFPEQEPPKPHPTAEDMANLEKARMDYAFKAARIALGRHGTPSKTNRIVVSGTAEEQRYLWTALVILGEKNPYMRFGPEALKVPPSLQRPQNSQNRQWKPEDEYEPDKRSAYNPTSLYQRFIAPDYKPTAIFRADSLHHNPDYAPVVQSEVKVSTAISEKKAKVSRMSKTLEPKVVAAANTDIKTKLGNLKKAGERKREIEGPVVVPPTESKSNTPGTT